MLRINRFLCSTSTSNGIYSFQSFQSKVVDFSLVELFVSLISRRRKGPNEEEEDEDDDNNNDRRIGRNNNKNNEDEEGRDDNNEDDEEDNVELLSLTFSSYPKILPRICAERRHPLRSPFGHLCPPNTKVPHTPNHLH